MSLRLKSKVFYSVLYWIFVSSASNFASQGQVSLNKDMFGLFLNIRQRFWAKVDKIDKPSEIFQLVDDS